MDEDGKVILDLGNPLELGSPFLSVVLLTLALGLALIGFRFLRRELSIDLWRWGSGLSLPVSVYIFAIVILHVYVDPQTRGQKSVVAQIAAGLLAGGVVAVGSAIAWRTYQLSRETSNRTLRLTEQGQITERFTRAIDQLGSTDTNGNPNIEVRLGAIFALERISRDSEEDHWSIVEVLTAYVRSNAPSTSALEQLTTAEPRLQEILTGASDRADFISQVGNGGLGVYWQPREDVQAAVTVLGRRRHRADEPHQINLVGTWLYGADLSGLDLSNANLRNCILWFADLRAAKFVGSTLDELRCERALADGADFSQATLYRARFLRAQLDGTNFDRARLVQADLSMASLAGSRFTNAVMAGAMLRGVITCDVHQSLFTASPPMTNFDRAILHNADFTGSILAGSEFGHAMLIGTTFVRVTLSYLTGDIVPILPMLQADFTHADMRGVEFDVGAHCSINPDVRRLHG